MVRVPDGCLEAVRHLISLYRQTGSLPVVGEPVQGDSHKQVDLPLPAPTPVHSEPKLSRAHEAWAVYMPVISGHPAYLELKERFFKLVDLDDQGYSYLFLLQLLERLVKLPKDDKDYPSEWVHIRLLRQFAKDLYKANPQWH